MFFRGIEGPSATRPDAMTRRARLPSRFAAALSGCALMACGAGKPIAHIEPPSPPARPELVESTVAPPAALALLLSARAPARDLRRLARLIPEQALVLESVPAEFKRTFGAGIGTAMDLDQPFHVGVSSDSDELVAFSSSLSGGDFRAGLPSSLYLESKSESVQAVRVREGNEHPWIGSNAACDLHDQPASKGVLICAPDENRLGKLESFLAQVASDSRALPALRIQLYPPFARLALEEFDDGDPVSEGLRSVISRSEKDLESTLIQLDLDDAGMDLTLLTRYAATLDVLSVATAGPPEAGRDLPPEFELPPDALFGVSFVGADPAAMAPVASSFWAEFAESLPASEQGLHSALEPLSRVLLTGGSVALAYGLDFEAFHRDLLRATRADEAPFGASTAAESEVDVPSWWLMRLEDDFDRWRITLPRIAGALRDDLELRVETATGLPAHAIHVAAGNEPATHFLFGRNGKGTLIVASRDSKLAARVLLQSLRTTAMPGAFQPYFRPRGTTRAAGLGFVTAAAIVAPSFEVYSAPERRRTFRKVERILAARERWQSPAPIRYEVVREKGKAVHARGSLRFSNAFLRDLLPELIGAAASL
jgi:hypothetical protein